MLHGIRSHIRIAHDRQTHIRMIVAEKRFLKRRLIDKRQDGEIILGIPTP
jgi:hypothetical protein